VSVDVRGGGDDVFETVAEGGSGPKPTCAAIHPTGYVVVSRRR
jgi:hypothetical protein